MADLRWNHVLQQLRGLVRPPDGGLTDAQLLCRWLASRDEAAFELLVWRHGPTVLGVCQRLLRGSQDIEDAFQATFLVFLRRAGSISKREAVASWLYKVAYRIALQGRRQSGRLQLLDGHDRLIPAADSSDETAWQDIRPVLDEEVSRLPVRYRAAFVLCCLQGKTNEEAARELGVPLGTLLSRLSRARARLRSRLTRRGVTLGTVLVAGVLTSEALANVPAHLVGSTMKAVLLSAAETVAAAGVVTAQAAALTKGALHAMWLTKMQTTAAVVLSVVLLGGGSAFTYYALAAGTGDGPEIMARVDPPPGPTKQRTNRHASGSGREIRAEIQRLNAHLEQATARTEDLELEAHRQRDLNEKYKVEIARLNRQVQELEDKLAHAQLESGLMRKGYLAPTRHLHDSHTNNVATTSGLPSLVTPPQPPHDSLVVDTQPAPRQATMSGGSLGGQPSELLENAQDTVAIAKAQFEAKRAELASVNVDLDAARKALMRTTRLYQTGSITNELLDSFKAREAKLTAAAMIKKAELEEQAIRLRQATRRLDRLRAANGLGSRAGQATDPRVRELRNDLERLRQKLDALDKGAKPHAAHPVRQ